jgi:hypothetical protein
MIETIQKILDKKRLTGFAVSDKFQPELAADSHRSALKSVQCNARIGGIEQTVERSAAGLHADGHGRLGEAILLHGGFDPARTSCWAAPGPGTRRWRSSRMPGA